MNTHKYNRTLHLPWSPGGTSDDKIATDVSSLLGKEIIITEKIDGSNASLEAAGCFARTHSGPPTHESFDGLKALHAGVKYSIPDNLQIFGEWCYARHSIEYDSLPGYFLMFGIRELGLGLLGEFPVWFSWDETQKWAENLGIPTVPVLWRGTVGSEKELRLLTEELTAQPSCYGKVREGVVIRIADVINDFDFSKSVMKRVRKDHVQTDDHWRSQEIVQNKLASI